MSDLNLDDIRARAEVAARELYEGPWQEPDAAGDFHDIGDFGDAGSYMWSLAVDVLRLLEVAEAAFALVVDADDAQEKHTMWGANIRDAQIRIGARYLGSHETPLRKALDGLDMIPFTSLPTSPETTE